MSESHKAPEPTHVTLELGVLEHLRDQLRERGQRPSIAFGPQTSTDLIEAIHIVEEYGAMCEAMYLMMAVDNRVVNAEREVLRGALDVLSSGRVRTVHMEAMLDSAARKIASDGAKRRLEKVIDALKDDPARAEATVILAAAVAAADSRIVPEEHALLNELFRGLGIDQAKADEILGAIDGKLGGAPGGKG